MSRDEAFFIYPHIEKANAAQAELERLAKFGAGLPPASQVAFVELLSSVEGQRQVAYLAPYLNAFEFVLLCMLAELAHRVRELEGARWVHPPFP